MRCLPGDVFRTIAFIQISQDRSPPTLTTNLSYFQEDTVPGAEEDDLVQEEVEEEDRRSSHTECHLSEEDNPDPI